MDIVFDHPIITLILIFICYQVIRCLSESKKRRKKYLDKILHLMNVSSINFFKIAKKQAIENPYSIEAIKKFSDFVFLSDFEPQHMNLLNANIDSKNIYLIDNSLKKQLIAHKYRLLSNIQWNLIDKIKVEYMFSYAKMASRDIDTKDFNAFFNPLDAYTLPNNWNDLRSHIVERDKYTCVLCAGKLDDKNVHIHHIIYRAHGGSHHPENLVSLCKYCHATLPKHTKISDTVGKEIPYYCVNIKSKTIHREGCRYTIGTNIKHLGNYDLLIKQGYRPCSSCNANKTYIYWDGSPQNKKIILYIYKHRPNIISKVILSGNPLLDILDKKYFYFDENALLNSLNPNEHHDINNDFLME